MYLLAGIGHVAVQLMYKGLCDGKEREFFRIFISWLRSHFGIVQRTTIYPWGSPCFHSSRLKAMSYERLSNAFGSFLSNPATAEVLESNVYNPIEESTVGKHYAFAMDNASQRGFYSYYFIVLYEYFTNHFLKKIKVRQLLQL